MFFALFLALPLQAEAQTTVWSATLTPRAATGVLGCTNSVTSVACTNSNNLSDDDFTHDGTDYSIKGILDRDTGQLQFELDAAATAETQTLTLVIDGVLYVLANADYYDNSAFWRWNNVNLTWSAGTDVSVSLVGGTPPTLSTDATLSDLELENNSGTGITLSPTFASGTTTYTALVANAVDEITIIPTVNESNATYEIQDGDGNALSDANGGTTGFQVDLSEGENEIQVEVTAQDGNTTETYEVTVTRSRRVTTTPAAPPEITVPNDWSLIPAGLGAGDKFRLIFLSSTKTNATSYDIADYNTFIQGLAAAGHTNIQTYSSGFRAVGCTADSDARDNTATTGAGVRIHWLNGNKVADNYGDFYDGDWDEERNSQDKNELGANGPNTSLQDNWPYTGCAHNGTESLTGATSLALGAPIGLVRVGRPGSSGSSNGPISSDTTPGNTSTRPMYGLSQVFEVAASTNNAPTFSSTTAARSVDENTAAGQNVGGVLTATDSDGDTLTYTLEGTDMASFDLDTTTTVGSARIQTKTGVTYNHEAKSTYTVVVKADDGNSGTATITVTITVTDVDEPPGRPAAPTVTAVTGSTTSLAVSWTAPENTGRPPITGYSVRSRVGSSGPWISRGSNLDPTFLGTTILNLSEATEYQVQVRATNDEGDSSWSQSGTGTTGTPTNSDPTFSSTTAARNVPENTAAGQNVGAVLTATDSDGDTLTYTLEGTDATSFDIATVSGSAQIQTLTALDRETKSTYTVVVKADDSNGGTDTITVTITVTDVTEPPGRPDPPTVTATSGTTDSLDVSWNAPTNTGPDIDNYDLRYHLQGDVGNWTNGPQNVTGTSASIASLDPGTEYAVQVRATSDEGNSDWSTGGRGTTRGAVTVRFEQGTYSVAEGGSVTVTVRLSADPERTVTIPILPTNQGGATNSDYSINATSVAIGSGNMEVTFGVTATQDSIDDDGESVDISFGTLPAGVTAGSPAVTTVSITDNDTAGVTVSPTTLTVTEENATGDTYTVVLDSQPTANVTIGISGQSGTDVTTASTPMTFTTVNWETAQTVTVTAGGDADLVDDLVTLTHAATSSDGSYSGITIDSVAVTVEDNDTAQVTGLMVEPGNAQLVVQWTEVDNATGYQVQWKSGGQSYNNSGRQATIGSGSTTSHTITSLTNGTEYTVRVRATRTGANNGPYSAEVMETPEMPTAPGVTVSTMVLTVTEENTTGETYTVVLDTEPTASVVVTVTGHASTDVNLTPSSGVLTFTTGNWETARDVTVKAGNDVDTTNDTVTLTHAATGSDTDYSGITIADVVVTVEDNDTAQVTGVMIEPGNAQLVVQWTEVGNATGYQVQWKSGGQSYNNSGRQATITSGTTISHTIPSLTNGTEYTVRVRATRTGANDGPYSAEEMETPEVPTAAGVTVSKTSVTVTEEDATGETYTVVLNSQPTASVVVTVAGHSGTDVTAAPTPLTFTSTAWNTPQPVTAEDDADTTSDTVTLTHSATSSDSSYSGITIASVTVTVNDNDTGNNPPVFSQGTSATLSFSGAAGNVGAVVAGDADGDTLTYSLGGPASNKFDIDRNTGQISTVANETYTPGDVYTVTVTADDGNNGGTDTIDVTIRVRTVTPPPPANGSPEFGASSATRSMEETVGDAGAETAVSVGAPVTAADPDGDAIEYSLGGTDKDKFDIDGNTGQILGRVGERYDHEEKQSYEVTVSASDGEGGADTIEVIINIDNVSEAPEAPGALRVRASGMTALGVTWSAPRNAGRPEIEGYDLRYRNTAETEWSDGPGGVEETETEVQGLLEDTEYEVQVRAVNAEGAGEWSQAASGRTGVQPAGVAVAWLGRFGRTVAEHVLSGVSARITALRSSGMKAALGGLDLFPVESPDELPPGHEDREEFGDWFGEEEEDSFRFLTMAGNDIKTRSSFVLGRSSGGGFGAVWGSGAFGGFNGRESGVSFEGDVRTGMLGADYAVGGLVGGVALSRSVGEGSYRNGRGSGKVKSSVTGIYPYAGNELSEKFSVWAVAGYGRGEMKVTLPGDGESGSADIYMKMAAAGARGDLVSGADEAGIGLSVEMDTLFVRTTSDGGRGIEAVEADVSRVRLSVEGSLGHALGDGGMLRPLIEAGIRRDGGDAETGFGADLGAGLQFSDTSGELSMQIMGRTLIVHEAGGFQDWGVSGSIRYDPYPDSPRGLMISLAHGAGGASDGGADALLGRGTLEGLGDGEAVEWNSRLVGEAGYGFGVFGGVFTGTPYMGFGASEGLRDYYLGLRLARMNRDAFDLEFGVEATREESAGAYDPIHGMTFRLALRR